MNATVQITGPTLVATLTGRLDTHGTQVAEKALKEFPDGVRNIILDLSATPYLSSAGLRFFLALHKECALRQGMFCLAGLQEYCHEVLRIGGLESHLLRFPSVKESLALLSAQEEEHHSPCGSFTVIPGAPEPGGIEVLGQIQDVLASRITPELVRSKTFSAKQFSLGLGAMGPDTASVLPLLGEMITVGGTMVWLPTDGNDTPDYLVPKTDSALVTIRTGFNASLSGPFNEFLHFRSSAPEGATVSEIYRAIFELARGRREDFRGAIGLAMRADVAAAYGAGVTHSPVTSNAPANGKLITDPSNFSEWFEFDATPRHHHVTGLICGTGLDLTADLSVFDQGALHATFYVNPANTGSATEALHNHGVFFSPLPFPDPPRPLDDEIAAVVENGDFLDMRHLLDATRITRALIGVIYVQDFQPDPAEA